MRTIEEVVSELSSELIRFLNEPKDQRGRVKANLDHLKCGKFLNEIVEIHKAEKDDVLDKIKAEIEKRRDKATDDEYWGLMDALRIIDKYKGDTKYAVKVVAHGNCMNCGKGLTEGIFFCKECMKKAEEEETKCR